MRLCLLDVMSHWHSLMSSCVVVGVVVFAVVVVVVAAVAVVGLRVFALRRDTLSA